MGKLGFGWPLVCGVSAFVLASACSDGDATSGAAAAGAAGSHEAAGAANAAGDDGAAASPNGGAPRGIAERPGGGAGLSSAGNAGEASAMAEAGATGVLEYSDDLNAIGDWQLMADPDGETASAEIKNGKLLLLAEQLHRGPKASAELVLADVPATPPGKVATYVLDLTDSGSSGGAVATLTLQREPTQVTLDLVELPAVDGRLVVRVTDSVVAATFADLPVTASIKSSAYTGPTRVAFELRACAADFFATAEIGLTQLEIRTE